VLVSPGLSKRLDIVYHFCEIDEPLWANGPPRANDSNFATLISKMAVSTARAALSSNWGVPSGRPWPKLAKD